MAQSTDWREALDGVIRKEPCHSCERGYTYPGEGRHRCYTAAELREWSAPPRRTKVSR